MNDIPIHVLRILTPDEPVGSLPPGKHDAYEALARRHRSARQIMHHTPLPVPNTEADEGDSAAEAHPEQDDCDSPKVVPKMARASDHFHPAYPSMLKPALPSVEETSARVRAGIAAANTLQQMMPAYVAALGERQHTALRLIDFLADRVADFCGDAAVLSQGCWQVTALLDPAILPATKLQIRLSYFDLHLRFESRNASEKQLILDHSDVLKSRLEVLLTSQGVARDIEILLVRSIAD